MRIKVSDLRSLCYVIVMFLSLGTWILNVIKECIIFEVNNFMMHINLYSRIFISLYILNSSRFVALCLYN